MSWLTKLKNTFTPRRLDNDLADEIRDHIERRASDLHHRGLPREEAERRAALVFGNTAAIREQSRDLRLWTAVEGTFQDIRYAWRGLLRNPVFAITAVVSLSLAIGANTAIYAIVDAVMLRSLPVMQPDNLFSLATPESSQPGLPVNSEGDTFSFPLYEELRETAAGFARLALFDSPYRVEAQVDAAAPREDVIQQFVSVNTFETLGVAPALGQFFSATEDRLPSPRAVVVLSHDYWRRHFGADPAILGKPLIISGRTYSILGVTREGFSGVEPGKFVDVWLPVTLTDPSIFTQPEFRPFHLLGRLAPGATREQVTALLQTTFHRHQQSRTASGAAMPTAMRKQLLEMRIEARPGSHGISAFRRTFSRPLWILLGVAACILLIACANVASLLLARSTSRSGEMALRVSLGAGRARLMRQMLTESLLISLLASAGGWFLACVLVPALVSMTSSQANPVRINLELDGQVLLACAAICALSALFFGFLPAWQATIARPMFEVRRISGQSARLRLGRLFVGIQVAFAFCLVTGGAGFLFSLRNLTSVDTGFDSTGVTVLTVTNDLGPQQRDRQLALMQQLQMRTGALPNVQGAATAWMPIFSGGRRAERVVLPGKQPSAQEETFYRVSPGYLATLRTPLLAGRDFAPADNDNEPIPTIINRAFAARYFGSGAALGHEFQGAGSVRHQVVGIAANSHYGDLRNGPEPIAYIPMKPPRGFTFYVRSTLDTGSVAKIVDREAKALGSGMRVRDITTLDALVGNTILNEKLLAGIGGAFAFLGLVLAAIGLFGLLNYSVTRRTKELGIRATLGAKRSELLSLVLKDSLGMIAGGLIVGLAGSLALMRFSRSLLFGIQPADPIVIATAIAVFLAAALIASGLPALRAAAIDPLVALRQD